MSLARNLSKFKPSSSGLVETADIADDAVSTDQIANNAVINTSGAITTTGAFTSQGIDDNADATAITITSAEAVGIGKSLTPNNYSGYQVVTIGGSDATTGSVLDFEDSNGNIEAEISGTAGRLYLDADPSSATASGFIHLGVDGNQVLKLDDSKNVTIADGNLVIGTAGKGIDFSAQTLSSNIVGSAKSELLDHYETGQFNADITSTTGSGDVTIYNHALGVTENQASRYVRIGSLVTVFGSHVVQSWGSRTGTLRIANLPFPIWGGGGYSGSPTHFPADTRDASVTMSGGASYFQFSKNNGTQVGGTTENWQISDLLTMKYLTYTFTYFTNIT